MSTEVVNFFTTGRAFTRLLRDLLASGEFGKVIEILRDGGLCDKRILKFLDGELAFEGDSRHTGELELVEGEGKNLQYLLTGWRTYCKQKKRDIDDIKGVRPTASDQSLNQLFDIITPEAFKIRYRYDILKDLGYKVYETPCLHQVEDGVITRDGYFVECGFQGHVFLYPHLERLGLANWHCWTEDDYCFHISSKGYSGRVAWSLNSGLYDKKEGDDRGVEITDAQLQAVFNWREHFNSFYSDDRGTMVEALRRYEVRKHNKGAKYGNLMFLKRYYAFNTPVISTKALENSFCVRTSPKRSMPGMLDSYFDVTKENYRSTLRKIVAKWKLISEENIRLTEGNKLNVFCQEYVEGRNGVCHYKEKGDFTYDVGIRGQVVRGENTASSTTPQSAVDFETIHNKLRPIARELSNDLGSQIQIEFVVNDDEEIIIIQLRKIDTPFWDNDIHIDNNLKMIVTGYSFTRGITTADVEDCIIVDGDVESKDVIGKKAIIVRSEAEFSHALALSQSLDIPSIYGIGDVKLEGKLKIDTRYKTGIIYKAE